MHARITARLAVFAMVALAIAPHGRWRRMPRSRCRPTRSARGGTWSQTVNKEAAIAGEEFDKKQMELIQKVTAYFNQMTEIKGLFVQTSADNKRLAANSTSSGPAASVSTTIPRAGS